MCSVPGRRKMLKKMNLFAENQGYAIYSSMIRRSEVSCELRWQEKKQHMLDAEIPHVMELDVQAVSCPRHVLKVKHSMDEISSGETLMVKTRSQAVINDLQATCHVLGYSIQMGNNRDRLELYVTKQY